MGRILRPDPEGGWHHVMNRGAGRRDIFRHAGDARRFLDLVGQSHHLYGTEVHAFCLMPNHFHLLLHCANGGISEFMHRVGSMYTRSVNDSIGSDGPIFRGRFRSILCTTPSYVDNVGRYIHRNPADLQPSAPLSSYRWSSYAAYLGLVARPNWLNTSVLLDWHGGRAGMRDFVEGDSSTSVPGTDLAVWQWAIETAIAEQDISETEVSSRNLTRTITLGIAERLGGEVGQELLSSLPFPNNKARNSAATRVRKRLRAGETDLHLMIERAIGLAA
ncbi:MAG TPA: transposase [Ilumatobacter sp.]|nr:transposase [Ilumatobacter sp.]